MLPQLNQQINNAVRDLHRRDGPIPARQEVLQAQGRLVRVKLPRRRAAGCKPGEVPQPLARDLAHRPSDQESIVQRVQLLALGQLVARADQAQQRDLHSLRPVVEEPLVEQREQRVQDRRVRLEDLVHEGDLGGGQVAVHLALVPVLLETLHAQRPEELLGNRKTGEEALEVATMTHLAEPSGELGLGGTGRAEQEEVLPGQRGQ
mmetsp:Transcript_7892/g.23585  ORF Transcript_7892/g.23585 Transcript_7892/m.23585 type:complete len:205 (-) Transcript_7892:406-1020(-)